MASSVSFFDGAKGIKIGGGVHTQDIEGDYIDNGHTTIDEGESIRESYDQRGATGVSNDHATLSGSVNKGGAGQGPMNKRNGRRTTRPEPRREESSEGDSDADGDGGTSPSPARQKKPSGTTTFFHNAEDISIGGEVTHKKIAGNVHSNATKHINRRTNRETKYLQQDAIGVANGHSVLSGAINVGGGGRSYNASGSPQNLGYSDSDDTSGSEASYHTKRHIDQSHSVGVANGNATFRGRVNVNYGEQDRDPRFLHPNDVPASHARYPTEFYLDQTRSVGLANDNAMFDGNVNVTYGRQVAGYANGYGERGPPPGRYAPHPAERRHYEQNYGQQQNYAPPADVFQIYNNREIPGHGFAPAPPAQGYAPDRYGPYDQYGQQQSYQAQYGYRAPPGPPQQPGRYQPYPDPRSFPTRPQNVGGAMSPPPRQEYQSPHLRSLSPQPPPYVGRSEGRPEEKAYGYCN